MLRAVAASCLERHNFVVLYPRFKSPSMRSKGADGATSEFISFSGTVVKAGLDLGVGLGRSTDVADFYGRTDKSQVRDCQKLVKYCQLSVNWGDRLFF